MKRSIISCVVAAPLAGCHDEPARAGDVPAGAEWLLDGTPDERFVRVPPGRARALHPRRPSQLARERSSHGVWSVAHAARTDFAMLLGSTFLPIVGAGPLALDAALQRRRRP
jgi:hypothetical protein